MKTRTCMNMRCADRLPSRWPIVLCPTCRVAGEMGAVFAALVAGVLSFFGVI